VAGDLLFLSQRIPYPPDKGDKIRSFHILQHLARRFRVHLGCFFDDPADEKYVAPLSEMCGSMFATYLSSTTKRMRALRTLAGARSFSETCFHDPSMARWIDKTIQDNRITNAFVFSSAMAPYLFGAGINKVLDIVDVDSEKWRVYGENSRWPLDWVYAREAERLLALERRAALSYDHSLFVSAPEADVFLKRAPEAASRVAAMSNGVDVGYFDPAHEFASPFPAGAAAVVFTGTMNYRPNIEAVTWFATEIFPAVRQRVPAAEFWIVGAHPAPTVRALEGDGVRVTGQVPDVRPYLAHAACVAAPLKIARGVQNKVLEAMAMGRVVVATPEAREGIDAEAGTEIVVGTHAESLTSAVCAALTGHYPDMGRRARLCVQTRYGWQRNLACLDTLFPASGV
jgi:sugar transferase (PEP-CTERM/EpsH1 system associated)